MDKGKLVGGAEELDSRVKPLKREKKKEPKTKFKDKFSTYSEVKAVVKEPELKKPSKKTWVDGFNRFSEEKKVLKENKPRGPVHLQSLRQELSSHNIKNRKA